MQVRGIHVSFAHFDTSKYVWPINLVPKWVYDFPTKEFPTSALENI